MGHADIDIKDRRTFPRTDPLNHLLESVLSLFNSRQAILFSGTDSTYERFLPSVAWDRAVVDRVTGNGKHGRFSRWFRARLMKLKGPDPVYHLSTVWSEKPEPGQGIIGYILRNHEDYYEKGSSVFICPHTGKKAFGPLFFTYDKSSIKKISEPVQLERSFIRQFSPKNVIFISLPSYGVLALSSSDTSLMETAGDRFVHSGSLSQRLDNLIELVETVSLACLGQLRGRQGSRLLWHKEQKLRQLSGMLVESRQESFDLYEHAPAAFFSLNDAGVITRCNQRAEQLSGYGQSELKGKSVLHLVADKLEMAQKQRYILNCLEKDIPVSDMELLICRKNNEHAWIRLTLDTVKDRHGALVELRAMALDISSQKTLERQLVQSQKMEALGSMSQGIAHDFNNIISPIFGCSQLLLMDTRSDSLAKKNLEIIHQCARHAKDLVEQILTFAGRKQDEFTRVEIASLVRRELAIAQSCKPVSIEIRDFISEECGVILGDPVQLRQVVKNLLTNALHAMKETGGSLSVELKPELIDKERSDRENIDAGPYIRLEVSDTGCGMDECLVEKIFDPYVSTKTGETGTGIGLSVVYGIVQSHGGHIRVKSEKGRGSRFHVYFPVCTKPLSAETNLDESFEGGTFKGKGRVLLVENDEAVAFMVCQMLEKLGCSVVYHIDANDGYTAAVTNPGGFDLMVTDYAMPGMTGIELAGAVHEKKPDLPVVLFTGLGEQLDPDTGKTGIRAVLKKPVSIEDFAVALGRILSA